MKLSIVILLSAFSALATAQPITEREGDERDAKAAIRRPTAYADWQNTQKARVAVSLPLGDYMQVFEAAPEPEFESRDYWQQISGSELQKGIALPITAPGAVVRVSGVDAQGRQQILKPENLSLASGKEAPRALKSVSEKLQVATGDEGEMLERGTLVFKLSAAITPGMLTLKATPELAGNARYLVQVYEPQSKLVLKARAPQEAVLAGNMLQAGSLLSKAGKDRSVESVAAFARAPDGRQIALSVAKSGSSYAISETLDHPASTEPGLWEIEWKVSATVDGLPVIRQIRTAFAYGVQSAELKGEIRVQPSRFKRGARLQAVTQRVSVPVQVYNAGRYEVRGHVMQLIEGVGYPLQFVSTAQWLEPGERTIVLELNKQQLRSRHSGEPLQLQDIQLLDQTQLLTLESSNVQLAVNVRESVR